MKRLIITALAVCLSAVSAFAGHVDTYGIGSRATSMGGAMTAGTNDAFSVYYNPAAMTRIKKKTFTLGSHFVDPSLNIKDFDAEVTPGSPLLPAESAAGSDIHDESPLLIVPHMGYVHPVNDKLTVGVAFYVPYGLELEWSSNVGKNPAAYNTYHSYYMREVITPSLAYKVNDKLSIGAGVSLGKSKAGTEKVRYVPQFMKNPQVWAASIAQQYPTLDAATISTMANSMAAAYTDLEGSTYKTEVEDDFNYSFNLGVLYEMNEKLSFGLTFRSKSDTHMEGDTDVQPDATYWSNQNVDASVDIDTPNQLQLGVQYSPTKKWNLNFDITRTWWGAIQDYSVEFEQPFMATPGISDGANEEPYKRDWKDTFQYRFGLEYKLNETVDLRAGYYYDPTVVPDNTFDVQWPDSNKHILSAGTGLHFGAVTVDLVVQYVKIEPIHISGESVNLNDTFTRESDGVTIHEGEVSATAEGHLMAYGVTVSYSF